MGIAPPPRLCWDQAKIIAHSIAFAYIVDCLNILVSRALYSPLQDTFAQKRSSLWFGHGTLQPFEEFFNEIN